MRAANVALSFKKIILFFLFSVCVCFNSSGQTLEFVKDLSSYGFELNSGTYIKTLINSSGETYVFGYASNGNCTATSSYGRYVAKFDANRNCLWFVPLTVAPLETVYLNSMILDNSGNVILNGNIYNLKTTSTTYTATMGSTAVTFPACNDDYTALNFIFKITSAGTVSWGKTYYEGATVASPSKAGSFSSMTCDASNNIYMAGEMSDLIYDGALRTNASHDNALLVKISSAGAYTSLVSQSTSAGSGNLNGLKVIFNPSSSRLFLVAGASTSSGASGGFAFANGATLSTPANTNFGLYFASLNTSLSVQSQAYYRTTDWAFINNYNSDIINSGDSIIYLNDLSNSTAGTITIGSTTVTGSATSNIIVLVKLSASNPNTVPWVKQIDRGNNYGACYLTRGQGDNVYMTGMSFSTIDFGNSVILGYSALTQTSFLYQFKASTGVADWAIKIPQTNTSSFNLIPRVNYSSFNSKLYLHISTSNIENIPYDFSVYTINNKLSVTSVTAATSLCPGSTISVNFSYAQTPGAGNVYTLQLSNEEGQFISPTNIGSLASTALTGTITGTIPAGIEGSPYMKVRVMASNLFQIGSESKTFVTVSTPNNRNAVSTLNYSTGSFVCEQLNITIAPPILYATNYQWMVNTGSGYVNVTNNATYSGATTGSLTITAAPLSFNGYLYRLVTSNSACPSVTVTETHTLTVRPRPSVLTVTPVSRCDAGTVSLAGTVSTGATMRWYSAATGGTYFGQGNPLTTSSISATTTYYADARLNGCDAFTRMPLVATVTTTPSISSAPAITRCDPGSVTFVATPTAGVVNWYAASTGGASLYTGTNYVVASVSSNVTYYADASISGCTTATRTAVAVTVYTTPTITSSSGAARCDNGVLNLSAMASAGNVLWYTATTGGIAVFTGTNYAPSLSTTTTYYVDAATANCTTLTRTVVVAQVTPTPTMSSVGNGARCDAGTVNINATPSGGTINWYTFPTGGSILFTGTTFTTPSISNTITYYAEPVHNGCIGTPRSAVVATVNTTPSVNSVTDGSICGTGSVSLGATQSAGQLDWYSTLTGGTKLGTGTSFSTPSISTTTNYYVEATTATCTTATRRQVVATIKTIPDVASVTNNSRCDAGTITLSATSSPGSAIIVWYSVSTGGTFVSTGNAFITPSISATSTYYVEAAENGCTTGVRSAIVATVVNTPTISSTTPGARCDGGTVSLGATASAGNVTWFTNSSGGSSVGTGTSFVTTFISTTTTYYVEASLSGCTSSSRTAVVATVNMAPSITTTSSGARCDAGPVTMNATQSAGTLNWYTASSGGTSIASTNSYTTPTLSSSAIYYVDATNNGCTTTPRVAVNATVIITPSIAYTTAGSRCDNGTVLIGASSPTGTINWYTGSTGGTVIGTGDTFTTPSISTTTTYYAAAAIGSCISTPRLAVQATVYNSPTISSSTPGARCGTGTVNLSAVASAGTLDWYTTASGNTYQASGTTFTTPSISSNVTYYVEAVANGCTTATRTAVFASVNPSPTFALSKTDPSVCGSSTGSIVISGLTAFTFYNVGFNGQSSSTYPTDGAGIITLSSLPAGSYSSFIVTAPNTCSTTDVPGIALTDPSAPSITGTTPNSRCDIGTVTLGATSSSGIIGWYDQPSAGTQVGSGPSFNAFNLLVTTTYYVEAANGSCKSGRTPVTATINQIPTVSSSTPTSRCGTGSVTISVNYSVGSVTWYSASTGGINLGTGNSLTIPSLASTTDYYSEALNNGCPSASRHMVTATVVTIPTISSATPAARCDAGTLSLGATASVGTVNWYTLSSGGASFNSGNTITTPSIGATTTYYAEAVNGACTSVSRSAIVAAVNSTPSITSTTPASRCDVGTVTIGASASAGALSWFALPSGGSSLGAGISFTTPSISSSTSYYVEATNNGCTSGRSAVLASVVNTPTITGTTPVARCDAGTVSLGATASAGAVNWFLNSTGGTSLTTGTSYVTPSISVSSTYYVEANLSGCITPSRTAVVATVTNTPSIVSVTPATLCGTGSVLLSATSSAGTIDWYAASTGGSSIQTGTSYTTPSLSSTATYYVSASLSGCTTATRTSVAATIKPIPTVLSTTPASRCNAGTLNLSATADMGTLNWFAVSTGGSSQGTGTSYTTPSISATATYYVESQLNGCISSRQPAVATVTITPSISSVNNGARCNTGSVTLQASSSTGTLNWYAASSGGTSLQTGVSYNTPSISTTTIYYVDATLNGCTSARSVVTATVTPSPTITATTPASRCNSGILLLDATSSAGVVNWYAALTGGTSQGSGTSFSTPVLSTTTTYYAEAVNNGCVSASRTPVVATVNTTPGILSVNNAANCGPGSLALVANASAGAVSWYTTSSGGSAVFTGSAYATPVLSSSTSYYVEASNNGCTSSPRVTVAATINPLPVYTFSSTHPVACNSPSGSFTLDGLSSNASYVLKYNGSAGVTVSTNGTGSYSQTGLLAGAYTSISVTDINNCVSNIQSVTLSDPGSPTIDAGVAQLVCRGDLVKLKATHSLVDSIWWNTGETIDSVLFNASGGVKTTYSVNVKKSGCVNSDTVSVTVGTDQSIIGFGTIPTKDVTSVPFALSSTSTSGLPVTYVSMTPSIATVSGNTVTIVGPGTASIRAIQGGDNCSNPAPDSVQSFLVTGKLNQFMTFGAVPEIVFGEVPFDLGASSSSAISAEYLVSDTTIARVVNGAIVGYRAGTIIVRTFAPGSSVYNPSDTVSQTVRVVIPPFTIFGKALVTENTQENYFISPNDPAKYTFSWNYKGSNTYYAGDTISKNVGIFFSSAATDNYLRCRVYSITSGAYTDVTLFITINHQFDGGEPLKINCDSLKGTFTLCSGKFINDFKLDAVGGDIVNANSGCNQGYEDYTKAGTHYTGELYLGESYNAEVKIGKQSATDFSPNYIGVWIDYNNNGSFDDLNEFLLSTYSNDSIFNLKNILINPNAELKGSKRLRIRVRSSGLFTYNESCYNYNESGETEDYKVTLVPPDKLEAPVLLTPNEDGKNDLFIIKGIYAKSGAGENKLTIMDRVGNILYTEVNYKNEWNGKSSDDKLLPRDTYYYNFINGDGKVIRGYFEVRY